MIKGWQYLWAIIALIVAVLLAYILITIADKEEAQSQAAIEPLQPSSYDERLNAIDEEAIEEAYRQQVILLFSNWMRDSAHHQPQRALTGHRIARKAFIDAMTEIDKR